jgi:hypothetical protein
MSFKQNLRAKILLDRLTQRIAATIRETAGHRRLDKELMRELLSMSEFVKTKKRDLELYMRPLEGETMEILVLDNELPIYHTSVEDVALRKSPEWKEMFSIRNVKRILNDEDVIVTKGRESLNLVQANALARLDLSFDEKDMAILAADARHALEQESLSQIHESFDLFFELLSYQPVTLGILEEDIQAFARPKSNGGETPVFEHLILFNEEDLWIGLRKGAFSPQNDMDLARIMKCARRQELPDLEGAEVFQFLAELALKSRRGQTRGEKPLP